MSKQEFLNFAEISKSILFAEVLNWLNVPYQKKNNELRGEGFIVSLAKNLFFTPGNNDSKGSVINFVALQKEIDLWEAASLLKAQFLTREKVIKHEREIPELTLEYHSYLAERGIAPELANEYEVGYVKQRSIISGRITFKVYDSIGYIGYKPENKNWFFPKGFIRPLYNFNSIRDFKSVVVTIYPFETLRIIYLGITQSVSLLANSMTADQESQLKRFRFVLLFHPEPDNIVSRLSQVVYIRAPLLSKHIQEYSHEELMKIIKPSKWRAFSMKWPKWPTQLPHN